MGRLLSLSTPLPRKYFRILLVVCVVLVTFKIFGITTGQQSTTTLVVSHPRILLVSALFPLEHSKHSHDDYRDWLGHFLGPGGITCDVYFYTTPELEPLVRSLHTSTDHPHKLTINTTYASPFDIPPLARYRQKYIQMHAWDRERDIHNPELYAVWNAKPWLLEQALHNLHLTSMGFSGGEYDYAFWNDAGSFRGPHAFGKWPDPKRIKEVFAAAGKIAGGKADLVFFPLWKVPEEEVEYTWMLDMGPLDTGFSEGSFYGSSPAGIAWFVRTYYALHDHYISTAPLPPPFLDNPHHPHAPAPAPALNTQPPPPPFRFVGKDQTLINSLIFRHPERFFGVVTPNRVGKVPPSPAAVGHWVAALLRTPPLPSLRISRKEFVVRMKEKYGEKCLDEWYYYQWWLAGRTERRKTEKMLGWRRWKWGWFGGGEGCEETMVVGVEDMLEGKWGSKWVELRRAREGDSF